MKALLDKLVATKGVQQAYLLNDGLQISASPIPAEDDKFIAVAELFNQIFSAIKSSNESYIELEKKLIIINRFTGNYTLLIITDKIVNIPMIHMATKVFTKNITPLLIKPRQTALIPEKNKALIETLQAPNPVSYKGAILNPIPDDLFSALKDLLNSYIGPVSSLIFTDYHDQWKEQYQPSKENILPLLKVLQRDIATNDEKDKFLQQAQLIFQ